MKYNYKINEANYQKTVLDFVTHYHLGNEKIKRIKDFVYINDKKSSISDSLYLGDILTIDDNEVLDIPCLDKRIDILYEDDNVLLVNKPIGIAIHSDGNENANNTLANMVASYFKRRNLDMPVRYIHRLDYDTSGIVIFAKDILTMSYLSYLLENHKIRRDYLAFVEGVCDDEFRIEKPIGRNRHVNGKYIVSKSGKMAITNGKTLEKYKGRCLVRLSLETGRTHQIRVHMASIGHPLLGDKLYGGSLKLIQRQALHSYYVEFDNPITKKRIQISCKLPADMDKLKK